MAKFHWRRWGNLIVHQHTASDRWLFGEKGAYSTYKQCLQLSLFLNHVQSTYINGLLMKKVLYSSYTLFCLQGANFCPISISPQGLFNHLTFLELFICFYGKGSFGIIIEVVIYLRQQR